MRHLHIRISHSHDLCWGAYSCFELLEVCMCESIVNYSKMQSCCFRLCISDTFYGRENKPFKKKKRLGLARISSAGCFWCARQSSKSGVCFQQFSLSVLGITLSVCFQVVHLEKHPCFQVTTDLSLSPQWTLHLLRNTLQASWRGKGKQVFFLHRGSKLNF